MTTTARTAPTQVATSSPATRVGPMGRITFASMATGVVGAAALVFGVVPDASEARVVGAVLVAFAAGWAMLAFLTTRKTTRPQRWAYVPATVMATAGTVLAAVNPGEPTMTRLAWVWAPALVVLAVWVERRTRRDIPGRARLLVYPVTLAMLLAGLGGLYQATTKSPQAAAGPMPGKLVDVGGYRLHLNCTGTGSPTVVLLNGLGETSPLWARVQPAVAATSRVCAYDRAGQGWSDDSSNPADATTAATDLHKLLTAAGETGPFVLAGHSSGGVHALTYTHLYPNDVAGVVLLDSASPHQVELVKPFNGEYQVMRRVLAVAPTLFRFGVGHALSAAMAAVAARERRCAGGRVREQPARLGEHAGRAGRAARRVPSGASAHHPRGHPAGRADREGQRRRQARLGHRAGPDGRPVDQLPAHRRGPVPRRAPDRPDRCRPDGHRHHRRRHRRPHPQPAAHPLTPPSVSANAAPKLPVTSTPFPGDRRGPAANPLHGGDGPGSGPPHRAGRSGPTPTALPRAQHRRHHRLPERTTHLPSAGTNSSVSPERRQRRSERRAPQRQES